MSDRRDTSKENLDRRYDEDVARIKERIDQRLYRLVTTVERIKEDGDALCEMLRRGAA